MNIRSTIKHLFSIYRWGSIGENSKIIKPLRILGERNIFIGRNVRIFNNARIETISNWNNEIYNGEINIGDNTSMEQNVHIVAADKLCIGHDVTISANVYISDCSHGYRENRNAMKEPLNIKSTRIGNYVFIGFGTCIMPGVVIEDNVVIGANSVVTHKCEQGKIYAGVPAREIGSVE